MRLDRLIRDWLCVVDWGSPPCLLRPRFSAGRQPPATEPLRCCDDAVMLLFLNDRPCRVACGFAATQRLCAARSKP